jgi:hypothetical protein
LPIPRDWQQQDRKILRGINTLVTDAAREPFAGSGKPEPLRGNLEKEPRCFRSPCFGEEAEVGLTKLK